MTQDHPNDAGQLNINKTERIGYENEGFVSEIKMTEIPLNEKEKDKMQEKKEQNTSDPNIFTVPLWKNHKICISKPLIPLKLALFCYYGAGSFIPSFVTIFYKQRGVSLTELSMMTAVSPIIQFIGSAISGIVADKIGRSKPVLITNLLFVLSMVVGMLLMPKIEKPNCVSDKIDLFCNPPELKELLARSSCNLPENKIKTKSCKVYCFENGLKECHNNSWLCNSIDRTDMQNESLSIYMDTLYANETVDNCTYYVKAMEYDYLNRSWCESYHTKNCSISCELEKDINVCKNEGFNILVIGYSVLFVLFLTSYSNCYRCMDCTVMFMAKEYNSDFGRERFFAILGNLVISPIAGYIAEITAPVGGERNVTGAFYLFLGMNTFLFVILYFLPVRVTSPGEKMFKKTIILLKNPDVLMFFIVIFILGTSWNFSKYFLFWYLEEMQAPSILIGMITSISALYGLPFLLTAKWWVKKIGSNRIIVLAFLAYVINFTSYSFLKDPWYSLLIEGTGIMNYYLLWVAVVEHSHDIAPEGLTSTVITISGAIHYSIGKASSGLTGGLLMNKFGAKVAFRLLAVICLFFAVFYALYIFMRKRCLLMKHKLEKADPSKEEKQSSSVQNKPKRF